MNFLMAIASAGTVWVNLNMGALPNINTAADAIAAAKKLCAKEIPADAKIRWSASYTNGHSQSWSGYSNGWDVDGQYDPKQPPPRVLSVIDVRVFIPKDRQPSKCSAVSN
jgi:hypothetical protein